MKGDYLIHRRDRPTGVHTSFICVTCPSPTHVLRWRVVRPRMTMTATLQGIQQTRPIWLAVASSEPALAYVTTAVGRRTKHRPIS